MPMPGIVSSRVLCGRREHVHFRRGFAELDEGERGEARRTAGNERAVSLVAIEESGLRHAG